jgi:hypothetical protein
MSLWITRRDGDGRRRAYAVEGLGGLVTLVVVCLFGLAWLFVLLVERYLK